MVEGLLEELETLEDLAGRVDVERRAVVLSEGGEADIVAIECPVAIDKGTRSGVGCRWSGCGLLFQTKMLSLSYSAAESHE
jgi:hypothetical protein